MEQQTDPWEDKEKKGMFCTECGVTVKNTTEICPACGLSLKKRQTVNKIALILFAFFLGFIGVHKFYLGKWIQGLFYLLFSWTLLPFIIALVECIIYAFTSEEELQKRYPAAGYVGAAIAVVAGGLTFVFMAGMIAAIAIPQFAAYKYRAFETAVESDLDNLASAEKEYFNLHGEYSKDLDVLSFKVSDPNITVEVIYADKECFEAHASHNQLPDSMTIDCTILR